MVDLHQPVIFSAHGQVPQPWPQQFAVIDATDGRKHLAKRGKKMKTFSEPLNLRGKVGLHIEPR